MHYFIGGSFRSRLTGIEKAQINRLNLFKELHLDVRMVYFNHNPWMYLHAKKFNIETVCFSMYDYFQESIGDVGYLCSESKDTMYDDELYFIKRTDNGLGISFFDKKNRMRKYAAFHDENPDTLAYINYLDCQGKLLSREFYDSRGFLNKTKYILNGDSSKVYLEQYYSPDGQVKIEKHFQIKDPEYQNSTLKSICLKNYHGVEYQFEDEAQLFSFFVEQLYEDGDIFYSDKHYEVDNVLATFEKIPSIAILHNIHTVGNKTEKQIMEANFTRNYSYVLENSEKFNKIIVSTEFQKKDIEKRLPNIKNIAVIPVAYSNEENQLVQQKIPSTLRIISVARYVPEKQLEHQLRLIEKLKIDYPEIELHMFGFGDRMKMKQLVKKMKLEDHVFIRGFEVDMDKEYRESILSIATSSFEGFCLAIFESVINKVPVISYDIRYGPNEIITNNKNGVLIDYNNETQLYNNVKKFVENYKKGIYFTVNNEDFQKRFSKKIIKNHWQTLLSEI